MDLLTWSLEAPVIEILIVEDNARFRRMLKSSIRERFPLARVATAAEGEAALRKIKATKPDLVFMDIRMPGRSGIVIAGEIQSLVEGIIARIKNQLESVIRFQGSGFWVLGSKVQGRRVGFSVPP